MCNDCVLLCASIAMATGGSENLLALFLFNLDEQSPTIPASIALRWLGSSQSVTPDKRAAIRSHPQCLWLVPAWNKCFNHTEYCYKSLSER